MCIAEDAATNDWNWGPASFGPVSRAVVSWHPAKARRIANGNHTLGVIRASPGDGVVGEVGQLPGDLLELRDVPRRLEREDFQRVVREGDLHRNPQAEGLAVRVAHHEVGRLLEHE